MEKNAWFHFLIFAGLIMATAATSSAGEIRVAVSSNFAGAITALADQFEEKSGNKIILIFGSTGKHYAQIKNGAPFEVFFAADADRPEKLEKEGLAVPGTRFTYALGKLVLWSPDTARVDPNGKILEAGNFHHLSLGNPKLAPYGEAARKVLENRGIWEKLGERIVTGQNIAQAFQFVESGNAELGFVAFAQIKRPGRAVEGSWWDVPQELYPPIEQQAVLLKESGVAREFLSFVQSDSARAVIRDFGYAIP